MRKLSKEEFIEKAKTVHGDKYGYDKSVYINVVTPITIYCRNCNSTFSQSPSAHMKGYGCWTCGVNKRAAAKRNVAAIKFSQKAKAKHGRKYEYDQVNYVDSQTNVIIHCNSCNSDFRQSPNNHLRGAGCPHCNRAYVANLQRRITSEFAEKATEVHGNKYNYDQSLYINNHTKLIILCRRCNKHFLQSPIDHIRGSGCPRCKESRGEKEVDRMLKKLGIAFTRQQKAENCRYKKSLKYDFYIEKMRVLVEYHGRQHYEFIKCFHETIEKFMESKLRDQIKVKWARKNGYKLIVIPYWVRDIEWFLFSRLAVQLPLFPSTT